MRRAVGSIVMALALVSCAHTPTRQGARADLIQAAEQAVADMEARDPTLRPLIQRSVAYVVFPRVGQGGLFVGGGGGNGVLFENGRATHFAELRHLEAGALAGGQSYSELVVVRDPEALEALRSGRYDFGAQLSATIIRTGTAATTTFEKGVAVFVRPIRGAMVNASLSGQRIRLTL